MKHTSTLRSLLLFAKLSGLVSISLTHGDCVQESPEAGQRGTNWLNNESYHHCTLMLVLAMKE